MNIAMVGFEEIMEIGDFGFRTRMIARNLAQAEWVGTVVGVCCPESVFRKVGPRAGRARAYWSRFQRTARFGAATVLKTGERTFMIRLASLVPEHARFLSVFDRRRVASDLSRALDSLGIGIDVLWVSDPRMADIAKRLKGGRLVFDCIDNLAEVSELSRYRSFIRDAYRWFAEKADLILIANPNQAAMFPGAKNLGMLPNGVDDVFFLPAGKIPADMASLGKPLVGYVGCLQDRFDIDLVCDVIGRLSGFTFVFIGPVLVREYRERLGRYPNTVFLGGRPFSGIHEYIKALDAVMVPHRVCELTNSMNPLKIYEALACGVPVVSTPISVSDDLRSHVAVAANPVSFAAELRRAVSPDGPLRGEALQDLMRVHSWKRRMGTVASLLGSALLPDGVR